MNENATEKELGGRDCFVGYHKMWTQLQLKGIIVKWSKVGERRDYVTERIIQRGQILFVILMAMTN